MLVKKGADVNIEGIVYDNALQAASFGDSEKIVPMLVEKAADVNFQGREYGNAMRVTSFGGSEDYKTAGRKRCGRSCSRWNVWQHNAGGIRKRS